MSALLELCGDLRVRHVPADTELLSQGAAPGEVYVLRSGSVEVRTGGRALARLSHPGALLGETSVLLGRPTSAAVVALDDVEVHVLDDLAAVLAAHPEVVLELARALARRVVALTAYVSDLREQYADVDGHLGMMDQVLTALLAVGGQEVEGGSERDDVPPL